MNYKEVIIYIKDFMSQDLDFIGVKHSIEVNEDGIIQITTKHNRKSEIKISVDLTSIKTKLVSQQQADVIAEFLMDDVIAELMESKESEVKIVYENESIKTEAVNNIYVNENTGMSLSEYMNHRDNILDYVIFEMLPDTKAFREMYSRIIYKEWKGMLIIFKLEGANRRDPYDDIIITKETAKMFGLDTLADEADMAIEELLYKHAYVNTKEKEGALIRPLSEQLMLKARNKLEYSQMPIAKDEKKEKAVKLAKLIKEEMDIEKYSKIEVLSNEKGENGCISVLYTDILSEYARNNNVLDLYMVLFENEAVIITSKDEVTTTYEGIMAYLKDNAEIFIENSIPYSLGVYWYNHDRGEIKVVR